MEREGGVGVHVGFFVVGDVELTVDGACVVLRFPRNLYWK